MLRLRLLRKTGFERSPGMKKSEGRKTKWNRTGHNHTGGAIHDRMKNLKNSK